MGDLAGYGTAPAGWTWEAIGRGGVRGRDAWGEAQEGCGSSEWTEAREPKGRRPVGREDSLGRTLAGGFHCPLEQVDHHLPLYSPSLF